MDVNFGPVKVNFRGVFLAIVTKFSIKYWAGRRLLLLNTCTRKKYLWTLKDFAEFFAAFGVVGRLDGVRRGGKTQLPGRSLPRTPG